MRRLLILVLALELSAAGCGGGGEGDAVAQTTTGLIARTTISSPPSPTTAATTIRTTAPPAAPPKVTTATTPTTTSPIDLVPVGALGSGLFCRDLEAMGYPYETAAWYWIAEERPERMDADGNGVPCETVYAPGDVDAFWSAPGNSGWQPIQTTWTVHPGCCSEPTTGPPSPNAAIPTEGWPPDGFYAATAERVAAAPATLATTMWHWVVCAELPDGCFVDWPPDAIVIDPASEAQRDIDLTNPDVTVVLRPINDAGSDGSFGALQGSGRAFASLLDTLGSSAGPYGTDLADHWSITTLEIRGGQPVLWVWAGQIAG